MSRESGREVAEQVLNELRVLTDNACKALMGDVSTKTVQGLDGRQYQVEYEAFWDDSKQKNIRLLVSASGGGFDDFAPATASFIISPDGCYVGENVDE
jgi:hypothetical protein